VPNPTPIDPVESPNEEVNDTENTTDSEDEFFASGELFK
jgi:hypothetical protein